MIYVASPYSDPNPYVRDWRFRAVQSFTAKLIKAGIPAYSPIAAFHDMSESHALPKNANYWRAHNQHMLGSALELYVLRLPGWDDSPGVTLEIGWAESMGTPISYHDSDFGEGWK